MTDNNDNLNSTDKTRRRRTPRRDGKGSNAAANAVLTIKPSSLRPMNLLKKKAVLNCLVTDASSGL